MIDLLVDMEPRIRAFTADTTDELDVFSLDGDSLCVGGDKKVSHKRNGGITTWQKYGGANSVRRIVFIQRSYYTGK